MVFGPLPPESELAEKPYGFTAEYTKHIGLDTFKIGDWDDTNDAMLYVTLLPVSYPTILRTVFAGPRLVASCLRSLTY